MLSVLRRFLDKMDLLSVHLDQHQHHCIIFKMLLWSLPVMHVNLGHWTNPAAISHAFSDIRTFGAIKSRCCTLTVPVTLLAHNIPYNLFNCKSHFWNIKNGPVMPAQVCRDCSACLRGGVHGICCMLHHTEHINLTFQRRIPLKGNIIQMAEKGGDIFHRGCA